MEYKGVEYQILQAASSGGFEWTVHLDAANTKTGNALTRGIAIFEARLAIDKALNDPRTR